MKTLITLIFLATMPLARADWHDINVAVPPSDMVRPAYYHEGVYVVNDLCFTRNNRHLLCIVVGFTKINGNEVYVVRPYMHGISI